MKLYYLAFSARGLALAQKLAASLGGEAARCGGPVTLQGWTEAHFETGAGLVYIGACGIAVRAAAPFLKSKETDPAVVAVDEQGRYAVPLLSGHLGGANALARAIGRACGAQPVLMSIKSRTSRRRCWPGGRSGFAATGPSPGRPPPG